MVWAGSDGCDVEEAVDFAEQLRHEVAALIRQDLLGDSHPREECQQLLGDGLSIDGPERDCLGVPCGVVTDDKDIPLAGSAPRQRPDNVHGDPPKGFVHDGERYERSALDAPG